MIQHTCSTCGVTSGQSQRPQYFVCPNGHVNNQELYRDPDPELTSSRAKLAAFRQRIDDATTLAAIKGAFKDFMRFVAARHGIENE